MQAQLPVCGTHTGKRSAQVWPTHAPSAEQTRPVSPTQPASPGTHSLQDMPRACQAPSSLQPSTRVPVQRFVPG